MALAAVLFVAGWLLLITRSVEVPGLTSTHMAVVQILPWYLLVAFGSYSLWCIGYNLFNFGDCPEASVELAKEVLEARIDLTKRGFKFDTPAQ